MIARRTNAALSGLALLTLASALALLDAAGRTRQADPALGAFVRRTGSSELALSTSSRWLRHPASAEPGAACADQPPCLDVDPAGLAIAPPRGLFDRSVSVRMEREAP